MLARIGRIRPHWRIATALAINAFLLAVIGCSFWVTDWQYSRPTPRPEGLVQTPVGSWPALPAEIAALRRQNRPLAINFANAQCPCTEFNLDHLRKLQSKFKGLVDFVIVLESHADAEGASSEFRSLHLDMPVVYDRRGEVSAALGVYGTPQAAILDTRGRLYFRGNYNRSRYCTGESSEYVRLSLIELAADRAAPAFPPEAAITYGCPLRRRNFVPAAQRETAEEVRWP